MARIYRWWLTLSLLGLCFPAKSQIEFEPGFFIDHEGHRTDCLIKNRGWRNNPDEFFYKITPTAEPQKATLEGVRAFGFDAGERYERHTVAMEVSPTQLEDLTDYREPKFDTLLVFLQVLVEGEADLFQFSGLENGANRFFFRLDEGSPQPLVYKPYLREGKLAVNAHYQQQLSRYLGACPEIEEADLYQLKYQDKALIALFMRYHRCLDAPFELHQETRSSKEWFRLSLRPGLRYTRFALGNLVNGGLDTDFASDLHTRLGVGLEFVMPFNRNKWSLMVEPTLQAYRKSSLAERGDPVEFVHRSFEANLASRYYVFLPGASQLFVSVGGFLEVPLGSAIDFDDTFDLKIKRSMGVFLGAGYGFGERWQGEFRYCDRRELLWNHSTWYSRYRTLELIVGYRLR